jgi:hypothetical protein
MATCLSLEIIALLLPELQPHVLCPQIRRPTAHRQRGDRRRRRAQPLQNRGCTLLNLPRANTTA